MPTLLVEIAVPVSLDVLLVPLAVLKFQFEFVAAQTSAEYFAVLESTAVTSSALIPECMVIDVVVPILTLNWNEERFEKSNRSPFMARVADAPDVAPVSRTKDNWPVVTSLSLKVLPVEVTVSTHFALSILCINKAPVSSSSGLADKISINPPPSLVPLCVWLPVEEMSIKASAAVSTA